MSVLITPEVARDIARIIRDHYGAMAAVVFGKDAVPQEHWDAAVYLGLVDPDAPALAIAEGLHAYGALLAHHDQAGAQARYGVSLADFQAEVARNPIPQTRVEHHAARHAAKRGAEAIVALGDRASGQAMAALGAHDADLDRKMRGLIRDVIAARFGDDDAAERIQAEGVAQGMGGEFFDEQFRSTVNRQISDIGHLTGDWSRDLHRVVQTETTSAIHHGIAESWEEQEAARARDLGKAPEKILVYRLPRGDACRYCVELYLDGGVPRVFELDVLRGNGTNVGKKRAAWLPVEGPTHPFCGCSLHRVPAILSMPKGWRSGDAAPSVIGAGGRIVM